MQNLVIGIFGYRGGGKTLMLVLLLYLEYLNGKKIKVNMRNIRFPTTILLPKELIKLSKKLTGCTIGIDELHTIADSRKSGKEQNINISNFFLQSRHRGVNVIYTDQYQGQNDKRIRSNTDIKIVARDMFIDSDNDGINDIFEYTVIDVRTEKIDIIRIYGKPIFKLYNDAEIIDIYDKKKK